MIKIDIVKNLKYRTHSTVWKRGVQYFKDKHVMNAEYLNEEDLKYFSNINDYILGIKGEVRGTYLYTPTLIVSNGENEFDFLDPYLEKENLDFICNCPYFEGTGAPCKHIVALALFSEAHNFLTNSVEITKNQKTIYIKEEQRRIIEQKNKFFDIIFSDSSKKLLLLHKNFIISKKNAYSFENSLEINLSISEPGNKKYKLSSKLDSFLSSYKISTFSFGKLLEYNPKINFFNDVDSRILEIAFNTKLLEYRYYSFLERYSTRNGFFVPEIFENEIFEIFKTIPNKYYKIHDEELKLEFNFYETEEKIKVGLNQLKKIEFLYNVAVVIFNVSSETVDIYPTDKNKIIKLKQLKNLITSEHKNSVATDEFEISNENLSDVINVIKNFGEVNLCNKLKKKVYIPKNIERKIYLDKYEKNSISLNLETLYDGKSAKEIKNIIINDIEDTNNLEPELLNLNFIKNIDDIYVLEGEENIYNFMNKNIQDIQKNYEVYYSNNLKNMKYNTTSLSLSSSIGETGILEFEFSLEGIDKSILPEYIKAIKEKKKFFRLKDGSILKIDEPNLKEINNIFSVLAPNVSELKQGLIKREKYYSYFFKERLSKIKGALISENLNDFSNNLNNIEKIEIPQNYSMLREYQKYGVEWLEKLNKLSIGGILADDMGLGKTLQTIVYIDINQSKALFPTIIIAPKSLVYNWKNEFQKFAPHLEVITLIGTQNERKDILNNINKNCIIITSYGILQRDIELYENISFKNIIIDEAQAIKNPLSKNGQCVKKLKGETKLALTGTPIENNLMELWSLFDFILPGYLNTHTNFQNHYIKTNGMEELKTLTHPFILRRMKKDVLQELPEKIETDFMVELDKEQKKLYLSYLSKVKENISEELNELNEGQKQFKILAILTRLRQICAHPKLFIDNYKGGSSKLELLMELLADYKDSGHRVLVFSQFTEMLSLIKNEFKNKFNYLYLDGKTSAKERMSLVNNFNNGTADVFLISLKAGGTGLNLTGADVVIHFDPWWNPAVEDQATDRAHRIGQEKTVQVVKLITSGTIEEKINKLKIDKKKIVTELFDGNQGNLLKLSKDDLLNLFN